MKTLYLDCGMGAAGDMLTAALYELLEENEKEEFLREINSLGLENVVVAASAMVKCGIRGTHMNVTVGGISEGEHHHEHSHGEHENAGHHHHNGMHEIGDIIENMPLSEKIKKDISAVYNIIASAESHVHGVPVTDIHFHEVGTMDAVADVTAVCVLMDKLGADEVVASAVHVGSGHVKCAHGILPVPAPATAYILKDVPIYGGGVKGELCTPTGAALLKYFVDKFDNMPVMKVEKIGYGMGKKDFASANCVRAILGAQANSGEKIVELTCNVDDMTAERTGFAMERLFDAGALEVYTVPVGMKKSRPGVMLCVMCRESARDEMISLIFKHTTTLGVRENVSRRYTLSRRIETEKTSLGDVRVKYSSGYGAERKKYEYDDISKIARVRGLSLDEVAKIIENEGK